MSLTQNNSDIDRFMRGVCIDELAYARTVASKIIEHSKTADTLWLCTLCVAYARTESGANGF